MTNDQIPTTEMSMPGRILHKATKRNTIARWAAINAAINSALIAMIFWTDGSERAEWAENFPAFIDAIAAKGPVLVSIATSLGLAYAAFRKGASG